MYQTTVYSLAFLYVMLALGLNIVVGIAGQLVLGYAAFYAVGAYTYALLNQYLGLGFWTCLPIAGFITVIAGLLLAFPVLRLRGDYLAIVTLGFGEIVRLLLINWANFTGGNRGIANIPRPGLFGLELSPEASTIYIYYLCLFAAIITIIIVARLINSRVGLALQALREDEIASEAMGIDLRKIKLSAFALGSCWAGFAGVLFRRPKFLYQSYQFYVYGFRHDFKHGCFRRYGFHCGSGACSPCFDAFAGIFARFFRIPHAYFRFAHGYHDGIPSAGHYSACQEKILSNCFAE